jgi:carboxyl-terminal processing protease
LYYTPSGRSIQASGITPDIKLDELKINSLSENPAEPIYLHESELKGHLKNGNNSKKTIFSSATNDNNDLVKNDYQLFVALNLLKSIVVLQNSKNSV